MVTKRRKQKRNLARYIRRTYRNKLAAILCVAFGIASAEISGDGTFMVLAIACGIPLFFVNYDYFRIKD